MIDFRNIKENEQDVLDFWRSHKTYEKSMKKNSGSSKKFYLMDGPPYATGSIHMGTALNKILKDIAMRARRLQGYEVFDRAGYDTHGVPIELQIEKEIGSKGKQDIERYGVGKFVEKCKAFATRYIETMNEEFANLGIWMDFEKPYLTLSDEWIEASWASFKEAEKKGLLYLGKYPVHVCTRCGTAVAYNEIEYGKQKDNSIFVKFPLKTEKISDFLGDQERKVLDKKKNTFLMIWTTTPWTLPGNTGVMVNPEVDYQEIETSSGERWIMAKELIPKIMTTLEMGFTPKEEFKGKKMNGWEYENPLAKNLKLKVKNGYKVVLSGRYVTTEDGTGLVHCAPGHGKEDYEVGKENNLDAPSPVGIDGILTEEAGKYEGRKAREVDGEIIEDLKKDGFLVYQMQYEHDYPLCWRDKTPLLMISMPQWFIKVLDIKKKLLKENEKNVWVPDWMKLRMKAWLEGLSDWPVSRQRYWGTPLPIWYDEKTGEKMVVGSLGELKRLSGKNKIDLHKPGIDEITIKSKTGKVLKRVPEVLDVWFDSGVASWAALGYPEKKDLFKKFWPADLNIEGRDQFRGWWNSQMILSQILFDKKPFEAIMVHGLVLDLGKKKMSKSLGNAISPAEIISKYGRDYMRYYFAKFSKGEDFSYDEKDILELQKYVGMILNIDSFVNQIENIKKQKTKIEDKWIESKFNRLAKEVVEGYNSYKFYEAVSKLEKFLVTDLSRTYIQMIRERSEEAFDTLNHIRMGLVKLYSPIMPLFCEKIWQEWTKKGLVKEESIHLSEFPKIESKKIDDKIEKEFEIALKIIAEGLAARDREKIGLKWPLAKAKIAGDFALSEEVEEIITKQLNVKKIEMKKGKELKVELDLKITPELEAEGFAREFARKIQSERKNAGLKKGDMIKLAVKTDKETKAKLSKYIHFLLERTNSTEINFADDKMGEKPFEFSIKEKKITASFS